MSKFQPFMTSTSSSDFRPFIIFTDNVNSVNIDKKKDEGDAIRLSYEAGYLEGFAESEKNKMEHAALLNDFLNKADFQLNNDLDLIAHMICEHLNEIANKLKLNISDDKETVIFRVKNMINHITSNKIEKIIISTDDEDLTNLITHELGVPLETKEDLNPGDILILYEGGFLSDKAEDRINRFRMYFHELASK